MPSYLNFKKANIHVTLFELYKLIDQKYNFKAKIII